MAFFGVKFRRILIKPTIVLLFCVVALSLCASQNWGKSMRVIHTHATHTHVLHWRSFCKWYQRQRQKRRRRQQRWHWDIPEDYPWRENDFAPLNERQGFGRLLCCCVMRFWLRARAFMSHTQHSHSVNNVLGYTKVVSPSLEIAIEMQEKN